MIIALAVFAAAELVLIGVLVRERVRAHPDLEPLLHTIHSLCQRLQAPGAAVLEHHERNAERSPEYAPPAIEPDNDEQYWLSREALAEGAMRYETEHVGHDGS